MVPPDLVAFMYCGVKYKLLRFPGAAWMASQMWWVAHSQSGSPEAGGEVVCWELIEYEKCGFYDVLE